MCGKGGSSPAGREAVGTDGVPHRAERVLVFTCGPMGKKQPPSHSQATTARVLECSPPISLSLGSRTCGMQAYKGFIDRIGWRLHRSIQMISPSIEHPALSIHMTADPADALRMFEVAVLKA
ncbi:uncharacterized [Tachysurus ichikawai]